VSVVDFPPRRSRFQVVLLRDTKTVMVYQPREEAIMSKLRLVLYAPLLWLLCGCASTLQIERRLNSAGGRIYQRLRPG
jgi:hypothetical protein